MVDRLLEQVQIFVLLVDGGRQVAKVTREVLVMESWRQLQVVLVELGQCLVVLAGQAADQAELSDDLLVIGLLFAYVVRPDQTVLWVRPVHEVEVQLVEVVLSLVVIGRDELFGDGAELRCAARSFDWLLEVFQSLHQELTADRHQIAVVVYRLFAGGRTL